MCASMSVIFANTLGRCFLGLYTNGTGSNLPEYRIIHGLTALGAATYSNLFVTQSTIVTLYKDEVYWCAMSLSGGFARIPITTGNTLGYGFNPVLGNRFTTPSSLVNYNGVGYQIIRSGSTNLSSSNYILPLTCSQDITQYNTGSVIGAQPVSTYNILMPSLKIQY
jgi:hypothetical protein